MDTHGFTHRARLALGVLGAAALTAAAPVVVSAATSQDLATQILGTQNITLATVHVSRVVDCADAHSNIVERPTAAKRSAARTALPRAGPSASIRGCSRACSTALSPRPSGSPRSPAAHTAPRTRATTPVSRSRWTSSTATEVLFEGNHLHCGW